MVFIDSKACVLCVCLVSGFLSIGIDLIVSVRTFIEFLLRTRVYGIIYTSFYFDRGKTVVKTVVDSHGKEIS